MAFTFVQSNSNSSGGSPVASLGVTLTGVGAGNLICIWVKHEGTPVGISVSDGTTTLTAGTKTDHGNGDLSGQFHYLLSANSGDKTYTVTFAGSVSRTFISLIVFEYSDSGSTFSLDGENGSSGNGTVMTSNNFTTTATDGVAFGGYGEYSAANLSTTTINGVAADATIQLSGNTFSGAWRKTFTSGFTGAAAGAIDNTHDWVVRGIGFKATVGGGGTVNTQTLTDTLVITDLGIPSQVRGRLGEDSIVISEISIPSQVRGRLQEDTIASITDGLVGYAVRSPLGEDVITVVDDSVLFYRRNRLLEDAIAITDEALASIIGSNIVAKILTSQIDVTDGAIFSIIRARLLQDTVIVSEGNTDQFVNTNIVADDTIDVSDSNLTLLLLRRLLGDDLTITDEALASIVGQNVITSVLTSTISTSDEAIRWMNRVQFGTSVVLTSDEVVKVMRLTRELTDLLDITDDTATALQRFILLTDALSVQDEAVAALIGQAVYEPVVKIGFDQPDIYVGGYAVH